MNEILLALLSFGLGMLATVATQMLSRRLSLADARRKRKIENLQLVRKWMEAYRVLFKCKYPELHEFAFAHQALAPEELLYDETAPQRLYQALKEFQEAKTKYEEAEIAGYEALKSIADKRWLDTFTLPLERLRRHQVNHYLYPRGFPRAIAPHLKVLAEQRYKLFDKFPEKVARWIDWDKLDYIKPSEVGSIIHTRLKFRKEHERSDEAYQNHLEQETALADARDNLHSYKQEAERAIVSILEEVRQYEEKWLTPDKS
jgi:hypothetical protein